MLPIVQQHSSLDIFRGRPESPKKGLPYCASHDPNATALVISKIEFDKSRLEM